MAISGDVWKYINPDLTTLLPQPTRPNPPAPADASTVEHTTLATLASDEREIYKLLYSEYKEALSLVKQEVDIFRAIRNRLVTSVSRENIVYIESQETIYDMLVALKKRLAPTDEARKLEVIDRYQRLRHYDKRIDVEAWCEEWETTYADALALNLPEVSENRSQNDFAIALSTIDEAYSTAQQFWLRQSSRAKSGIEIPSLYDMVEDFRNNCGRNQALKNKLKLGAFSANSEISKDSKANKDLATKPLKPYLCGMQYKYKNCYYITPSERPQGWKGKKDIFQEINRKVESLKNRTGKPLKNWFLSTFKYGGFDNPPVLTEADIGTEPVTPKSLGVFTTRSSFNTSCTDDCKLYYSWTLDNASDTHVCNDSSISNWVKTREAGPDGKIFAGKKSYLIEAFGTVTLEVNTDKGIATMQSQNVALAPGFMTNLVSLENLNKKGVHWNSEYPYRLQRNNENLCSLHRVGKHWSMQKDVRPNSILNSFLTSRTPRTAKFTANELHSILAHAGSEVINHVEGSDISIDISVPCPSLIECQTCSLTKAKQQISRRKEVEFESNKQPFFRIAWDMIEFEQASNGVTVM